MDFERDCLNNIVAPQLQEYYLRYGYSVRFFDLRWGVITDDKEQIEEREKKILRTCFDAIDNSQPFFIALLGHRYGWIPESNIISSSGELLGNIFKEIGIDSPSVTAMEIAYGIFQKKNYSRSLVFIRNKSSYTNIRDLDLYIEQNVKKRENAELLKEEIIRRFSENNFSSHVIQYSVNINESSESLPKMVCLFEKEIRKCIDDYIKIDNNSELNIYDVLSERALFKYVCPHSCSEIVEKALNGESVIIYGDEGYGKTSLSFTISNELKKRGNIVLYHTVGYSDSSYDPHEMIWQWNRQFETYEGFGGNKIKKLDSIEKEWARLHYLNRVMPERFTIIIDSIDKMQDKFCSSNLLVALPSNIQFIILSKEKLPNWEFALKIPPSKLNGLNGDETLYLINETCRYKGKVLSSQVVEKILLDREIDSHQYSPLDIRTILDFLLAMDAEDYKQIRNGEGVSEENKINNYMVSFIERIPHQLGGMYNMLFQKIEEIYGPKSIAPLKVLSLSRNGLDEVGLHYVLNSDFDLLQFTIVRQYLHQSLTDNYISKSWSFKQDTIKRTLINYESPFLPSNEDFLRIMSETDYLNEERIYYAVLIQNNDALSKYLAMYDDDIVTKELIKAKYVTSLSHILGCLTSCLTSDEELVDKVFKLLIFKLFSQTFDESPQERVKFWSQILEELKKKHQMKRERTLFLKARCNEILGNVYKSINDVKHAQNCYRQAICFFHILDMESEKEKCRDFLLNTLNY